MFLFFFFFFFFNDTATTEIYTLSLHDALPISADKAKFKSMDGSLKVCINGFYGFLGVGGYPYNSIESAALTTAYGRVLKIGRAHV